MYDYAPVIEKGYTPWPNPYDGPPPDFDWSRPVLLANGAETLYRGTESSHWTHHGVDKDIIGYHRAPTPARYAPASLIVSPGCRYDSPWLYTAPTFGEVLGFYAFAAGVLALFGWLAFG